MTRRLRIARVTLVAAVISLGGARPAAAQGGPGASALSQSLTWDAPAGCPSQADVAAAVWMTLSGTGAELAPFKAVVGVREPTGGRWQASLQFQAGGTRAERRFEAESCEAIASAVALVVALWAERGAEEPPVVATAPAPFEPPPSGHVQPVPAIATRQARDAAPALNDHTHFVLMANGLIDQDTMPNGPAAGVEVAGGPTWGGARWRVRALTSVSFFPSRRNESEWGSQAGDYWLLDVSTRGCATVVTDRFEIGPCAGAELAVMDGTSEGTSFDAPTQTWLSLLGSAVMAFRVSDAVALFGRGDLVVPTTQRSWNMQGGTFFIEGYRVPAYAGRGALGLELRFQ